MYTIESITRAEWLRRVGMKYLITLWALGLYDNHADDNRRVLEFVDEWEDRI